MTRLKITSQVWQILFIAFLIACLVSCTSFVSINRNNTGDSKVNQCPTLSVDSTSTNIVTSVGYD